MSYIVTLSIRLPDALERQLQEEARKAVKTRSELVRDIVADSLARVEHQRLMADIVAEAKALAENPEAVAEGLTIAEDFLPLENEALDLAEGRTPGEVTPHGSRDNWWT